jgi:hypothetical protein
MSVYAGPEITSNGLVLSLDAANPKSYKVNYNNYSSYYAWDNTNGWRNVFSAGATLTTGIVDPFGGTGAVRFSCTNTTNALLRVYFSNFTPSGTEPWVVSFYVRKISGTGSAPSDFQDLTPSIDYSGQLVTGEWIRVFVSAIPTATLRNFVDLFSDSTRNYVLDFFGLQVEPGTTPSNYTPTYGSIFPRSAVYDLSNASASITSTNVTYTNASMVFTAANSNSSILIPFNSTSFTFNTEQTISIWLRPTDLSARRNPYAQAYGGGGTITQELDGMFTYYHGSAGVDGLPYQGSGSGFAITANETAMITVVRNASDVRFYKNAVLGGVTTNGFSANTVTGTSSLRIGSGYVNNYQGNIFKVDVYNRALSAQEVRQNFYANRGRFGI